MSVVNPPPKTTPSGKIMAIVKIPVKEGKEAIATEALKLVQKRANSEEEPGTLTYRLMRQLDSQGNLRPVFFLFEEYTDNAAFEEHLASPGVQCFAKALKEHDVLDGQLSIDYVDDI
ncbi:hypothetical protein BDP27DRAFT_623625 [Rhodocollybia butyracea]|uniref:ABM domain-containing protein n=1 Tax=Rhodocollybia butyracea TaxID=206335 RepID=A0A9P5PYI5_9AGAR|nr:hypothetical protein BDP27DRAFT_623625 [Rhodocollybia butyracea]